MATQQPINNNEDTISAHGIVISNNEQQSCSVGQKEREWAADEDRRSRRLSRQ